jgi:hypothetical protein
LSIVRIDFFKLSSRQEHPDSKELRIIQACLMTSSMFQINYFAPEFNQSK